MKDKIIEKSPIETLKLIIITNNNPKNIKVTTHYDFKMKVYRINVKLKRK